MFVPANLRETENAVRSFLQQHADKITGFLFCPDRLIFKGHLSISHPQGMEGWLARRKVLLKDFKTFGPDQAARIKAHGMQLAERLGRPFTYLCHRIRMEDRARELAARDGVTEGLIGVFSILQTCSTFRLVYGKGRPSLKRDYRRCLVLYYYFLDPEYGLMHVRVPTWFPMSIQVYLNGHEWLARAMDRQGLKYHQRDNAFVALDDPAAAQQLVNRFLKKKWPRFLDALAKRYNPLLADLFKGMPYRWVIDQAEFAADVLFKDAQALAGLFPRLLQHALLQFGSADILGFLGRQRPAAGGAVQSDLKHTPRGHRVKHCYQNNWIKMYDKFAQVLRVEIVINHPASFRVRRWGTRQGRRVHDWFPLIKTVALMGRYAHVAYQAARRYLDGLAVVADPQASHDLLDRACRRAPFAGRHRRALNPLSRTEQQIFLAVLRGEHALRGFRSSDLAQHLKEPPAADPAERRRQSGRRGRLLQLLRAHGLIVKLPHTRRYRASENGLALMSTAIELREHAFPAKLRRTA